MREAKVVLIIGGRGCGKTFLLENTLNKNDTIVIELYKTERWDGYDKIFFNDIAKDDFDYKILANKNVVFEDATSYLASNLQNKIKQILIFSKQLGSDVFIVFHSVNVVPPFMWYLFNAIVLFRSSKPKFTKSIADFYDELLKKWQICMKADEKKYHYEIIESHI